MKYFRSSQVRIALVSVLTSAVGLLAFGGFAWWQMRASNIASLDRELLSLGRQCALAARWELSGAQMETALRARFGEERSKGWIFAIEQTGRPATLSLYWPPELSPLSLAHDPRVIEEKMPGHGGFGDDFGEHGPGPHGEGGRHHGPPPKPPSDFGLFFHD
ncbi:MAG: hypothetical protein JWO94_42, partial [Verrucomicrobiaceae bacterium]|nr:hypothetical protein [Verrucomicrobiaceae bacterium]